MDEFKWRCKALGIQAGTYEERFHLGGSPATHLRKLTFAKPVAATATTEGPIAKQKPGADDFQGQYR
ncbi:MAG: hypothetical protein KA586_10395 [Candidatus Promineofilum sp.]|nr:hypothetical protein [Promineifilum sp.]